MILALSLIIAICGFILVYFLLMIFENVDDKLAQRIEKLKDYNKSQQQLKVTDKLAIITQDTEYRSKALSRLLKGLKLSVKVKQMLKMADSDLFVDTFFVVCILCGLISIIIFAFITPNYSFIGIFAMFLPFIYLKIQIDNRNKLFMQQFPDALNMISSSLRAGHPLMSAFELVTNDMPKPVSSVFKTPVYDMSLGLDLKDALINMTKNLNKNMDLNFFITAVLIQREVGGNLAELLDNLSITIRERYKLMGQLKAQTAQSRFSAILLSIIPPSITLILFIISPEYMEPLLK